MPGPLALLPLGSVGENNWCQFCFQRKTELTPIIPTGTTVQDRFPLTQPVLRSATIQQSKAPQVATEEITARYTRTRGYPRAYPGPETATRQLQLRCQRRSRSPIGSVGDQLRLFPDSGLAQLVPRLVSLRSCRPLLLRLLPLLRSVVVLRGYRYLLSSSFQVNATFIDQNFDDYGSTCSSCRHFQSGGTCGVCLTADVGR